MNPDAIADITRFHFCTANDTVTEISKLPTFTKMKMPDDTTPVGKEIKLILNECIRQSGSMSPREADL
jgi:hypothetical protein